MNSKKLSINQKNVANISPRLYHYYLQHRVGGIFAQKAYFSKLLGPKFLFSLLLQLVFVVVLEETSDHKISKDLASSYFTAAQWGAFIDTFNFFNNVSFDFTDFILFFLTLFLHEHIYTCFHFYKFPSDIECISES